MTMNLPRPTKAPKTTAEALTMALFLAITAPTDEKAAQAIALADDVAADMTEHEVEACKLAAQAQAFGSSNETSFRAGVSMRW